MALWHDQCDAGPPITFLALEHRCSFDRAKLYCLVTEAGVQRLMKSVYVVGEIWTRNLSVTSLTLMAV